MSLIVADSGCDLRTQEVRVPFARVPLRIVVGGTEYEDKESLDIRAMMDHVYAFNGKTGTACPGPGEWAHCFRQDRECYALPISKGVSGSYDSAMIARDLVLEEDPTRKIHIIDARTAGPGMDLIAEKLEEYPQLEGIPTAFCWISADDFSTFYVYLPTDPRAAYLLDLGFTLPESVQKLAGETDDFNITVSRENADQLDDIQLMVVYGDEDLLKSLQEDKLMSQIPAIKNGAVALVDSTSALAGACTPSILSIPYEIDEYLGLFAKAAENIK